jgi:hypothetical protein
MVNFVVALIIHVIVFHVLIVFESLHLNLKQIERKLLIQQIELILAFNLPATFFIALVCAADPTRYRNTYVNSWTDPELNKSFDKKICPSVMKLHLLDIS